MSLASLKDRGNIVCADYVDDPARALHECLDGYIAASIAQFIHYSKRYADKLVHLITHHSDPRLNGIRGPEEYCNIGYFGEIANARHASELRGIIDFCARTRWSSRAAGSRNCAIATSITQFVRAVPEGLHGRSMPFQHHCP